MHYENKAQVLNRYLPKEEKEMSRKHVERYFLPYVIRKTLLKTTIKQQWDATTHLLKWPHFRPVTTPNTEEDEEWQELCHGWWGCPCGRQSGRLFLQKQIYCDNRIQQPRALIFPQEWKTYRHAITCMWIFNGHNLEAAQVPFGKGMDKYTVGHPENEIIIQH